MSKHKKIQHLGKNIETRSNNFCDSRKCELCVLQRLINVSILTSQYNLIY